MIWYDNENVLYSENKNLLWSRKFHLRCDLFSKTSFEHKNDNWIKIGWKKSRHNRVALVPLSFLLRTVYGAPISNGSFPLLHHTQGPAEININRKKRTPAR